MELGYTDCRKYVEDPNICDSMGEPKGQCLKCGDKWYMHRLKVLPRSERDSYHEIREHQQYRAGRRDAEEALLRNGFSIG